MTIAVTPILDVAVVQNAADTTIDLFNNFDDPRTTGLVARFELYDTSLAGGVTNVVLFDQADAGAPLTVQNFQNYVNRGAYTNSIIHRSIARFVVQGGGFSMDDDDTVTFSELTDINNNRTLFDAIPSDPPVVNEFSTERSNTRGTIAMAKVGGNPDSATNQWFFNLDDNSSNLDNQNGGFTVFGEVLSETDFDVVEAIATLPVLTTDPNSQNFLARLPFLVDRNNLPDPFTSDNFVRYRNISIAQRDELTFQVVSNSNPAIVNASISNNQLVLDYGADQSGTAEIVIRATNLLGETTVDTFSISIAPVGSNNSDELRGNSGDDVIDGLGGNDVILGLDGNDQLTGGGGRDRLLGGSGNDSLNGGNGQDNLQGGNGADILEGGGGKDKLNGGNGADTLEGGGANDNLNGGKGRDTLDGGKGSDRLKGGRDRDIFVLERGRGRDFIRDFKDGQDKFRAKGFSFNALTITQSGNNALISLGNDEVALVRGLDAELITRADFVR